MSRGNTVILNFVCACSQIQYAIQKKTEKHIKKILCIDSPLFLTRFSRDELFAVWTESDNFYSLQSLLRMNLTSVPQRSTVFGKSSDDKY